MRGLLVLGAVAVAGVAVGLRVSALTTAGAAPGKWAGHPAGARSLIGGGGGLRRAVHAEAVVPVNGRFVTVTLDRGFVVKVDGSDLTIREGTRNLTYKTVTLTIPPSARVRNDGRRARLSDLQAGEHVLVVQGPRRTFVRARHASG